MWTDDEPTLDVKIEAASGSLALRSTSQKSFMLPWSIEDDSAGPRVTWDTAVAFAIADLLPVGALNRDRLKGEYFAERVGANLKLASASDDDSADDRGDVLK
ncbi:MAG: hypothetical protein HC902_08990 [Calothrix sp. SM1_5_4]|nr:hypothetical protein [Calothrix sp. SM1_5_4]